MRTLGRRTNVPVCAVPRVTGPIAAEAVSVAAVARHGPPSSPASWSLVLPSTHSRTAALGAETAGLPGSPLRVHRAGHPQPVSADPHRFSPVHGTFRGDLLNPHRQNHLWRFLRMIVALLTARLDPSVAHLARGCPHVAEALTLLKSAPTITWNAVVTSPFLSVKRPGIDRHRSLLQSRASAKLAVARMAAKRAACAFLAHCSLNHRPTAADSNAHLHSGIDLKRS